MNEHSTAIAAAMMGLLIGAVVSVLDHALSFVAVLTAVLTATARYFAILRGAEKPQVERITARAFFLGFLVSLLLLALDRVLGG